MSNGKLYKNQVTKIQLTEKKEEKTFFDKFDNIFDIAYAEEI
jgi:hypothetical protein